MSTDDPTELSDADLSRIAAESAALATLMLWRKARQSPGADPHRLTATDLELLSAANVYAKEIEGRAVSPSPPTAHVWGYAGSEDAEEWSESFTTREEAITAGLADNDLEGADVWINSGVRCDPANAMTSAITLLEWMPDNAADREWGEIGVDAIDDARKAVSAEGVAELTALLATWARKWCLIKAWRVTGAAERVREAVSEEPERSDEG